MYKTAIYICISWYSKNFWFPVKILISAELKVRIKILMVYICFLLTYYVKLMKIGRNLRKFINQKSQRDKHIEFFKFEKKAEFTPKCQSFKFHIYSHNSCVLESQIWRIYKLGKKIGRILCLTVIKDGGCFVQ